MRVIKDDFKSYKICEAIPFVSSITSLACIILKKSFTPSNNTTFGRYLNSCPFAYLSLTLIPLVNIIVYLCRDKFIKNNKEPLISTPTKLNTNTPQTAQHPSRSIKKETPETVFPLCPITSRPIPTGAASGSYCFDNHALLKIHEVTDTFVPYETKDPTIIAMKYGDKHTVTQGTNTGCSGGVSLMLALDHGKVIDYDVYTKREAAGWDCIVDDLEKAGLKTLKTPITFFSFSNFSPYLNHIKLEEQIKKDGPAIIRIQAPGTSVAHWVILDHINLLLDTATIRDPWHGWCVDVKFSSFFEQWRYAFNQIQGTPAADYIIQIPKTP